MAAAVVAAVAVAAAAVAVAAAGWSGTAQGSVDPADCLADPSGSSSPAPDVQTSLSDKPVSFCGTLIKTSPKRCLRRWASPWNRLLQKLLLLKRVAMNKQSISVPGVSEEVLNTEAGSHWYDRVAADLWVSAHDAVISICEGEIEL